MYCTTASSPDVLLCTCDEAAEQQMVDGEVGRRRGDGNAMVFRIWTQAQR